MAGLFVGDLEEDPCGAFVGLAAGDASKGHWQAPLGRGEAAGVGVGLEKWAAAAESGQAVRVGLAGVVDVAFSSGGAEATETHGAAVEAWEAIAGVATGRVFGDLSGRLAQSQRAAEESLDTFSAEPARIAFDGFAGGLAQTLVAGETFATVAAYGAAFTDSRDGQIP